MKTSGPDLRLLDTEPPEVVVSDETQSCPYFPERTARMPLRMPFRHLTRAEFDERLHAGDRRWGRFLYHTECPRCRACEPIRIDTERFRPRRWQRRALAAGRAELTVAIGEPRVDRERLSLFERHKAERGLAAGERPISEEELAVFLVERCVESIEFRYYRDDRLVGVSVADRGESSLSAVYCYFEPRERRPGVGTYSILRQIEYCKERGLRWLYLGLFIAGHSHMAYKERFGPHQRLVEGRWVDSDEP